MACGTNARSEADFGLAAHLDGDQNAAAHRYLDVMAIVSSPRFAYQVKLADELELLSLLLAGRLEEAAARVSEFSPLLHGDMPPDLLTLIRQAWSSGCHAEQSANLPSVQTDTVERSMPEVDPGFRTIG
jgi:hypothetical protein